MSQLAIKYLSVQVENKKIISDLSLTIKPGEIHALMGPNGSGKSTLAYTLAGHPNYQVKEKSQVELGKHDLLSLNPDERAKLGLFLAFQNPVEIEGISTYQFLKVMWESRFGPISKQTKNKSKTKNRQFSSVIEFRNYVDQMAKKIGVSADLLKRSLNDNFSGGEKKRLEVLQLLVFQPKFAVLDETDSGLDIDALKTLSRQLQQAVKEIGCGMLIITHYRRVLSFIQPDFIHIMLNGKIVKSGGVEIAERLEENGYQQFKHKQPKKQK